MTSTTTTTTIETTSTTATSAIETRGKAREAALEALGLALYARDEVHVSTGDVYESFVIRAIGAEGSFDEGETHVFVRYATALEAGACLSAFPTDMFRTVRGDTGYHFGHRLGDQVCIWETKPVRVEIPGYRSASGLSWKDHVSFRSEDRTIDGVLISTKEVSYDSWEGDGCGYCGYEGPRDGWDCGMCGGN